MAIPTGEMFRTVFPKRVLSWERVGWSLVPLIVLGIIFNSLHQVVMNISLQGQISLAIPIMSSTPVFVMILSSIFLRDLERLNPRVVVGILITFMGMAAIGFGRHG